MFNHEIYKATIEKLQKAIPYEEAEYFNACFASAFAQGRENEINGSRIKRMMSRAVEQGISEAEEAGQLEAIYIDYFIK